MGRGDVRVEKRNTWKHLLDFKEADRSKKAVGDEIWKIGRKEFHTLVKSLILESARLRFKCGLTKLPG